MHACMYVCVYITYLQVDMVKMKMISPVPGDLRCTSYNAIQAQLKMGANNIFVQLRAYDIQVSTYVRTTISMYEYTNMYMYTHVIMI